MSCSVNRLKKLIHVGLAAPVAERIGLPTAEAGDLLEKVFQQSEYPANVEPAILSKAKQTAGLYCDSLFSMAEKSGYQLGHKGSQPTVKQTLGYANLWRTLKAIDDSTPLPPLAEKIAREEYGIEKCKICGRFYKTSEGCQNDHSAPDFQAEVKGKTSKAKPGVQAATQVPIPPQPSKKEKLPVFVYGTLRTGQGNWDRLLKGKTSAELPATLPGSKMYATGLAWVMDATEAEPPLQVQGELMFLDGQDYRELMRRLDGLEGYNPDTDRGMYRRVARMVKYTDENGLEQETLSWVYYAGDADLPGRYLQKNLVSDGDWLDHTGAKAVRPPQSDPAMQQKQYYFAFGSNMRDTRMTKRGVNFTRKLRGTLIGFRLTFNKKSGLPGIGYANIEPGDGEVEGVLYETTVEGLRNLDKYEGVGAGHYRQDTVKVRTPEGELIEAVVYVAEAGMTQEGLKPTKEYLDHLLAGQEHLSPEYYANLEQVQAAPNPPPPKSYNNSPSYGSKSSSYGSWGGGSSGYGSKISGITGNYNQGSMFDEPKPKPVNKDLDIVLNTLDLSLSEEQKLFRLAREYGMSVSELIRHFLVEKLGEQ